MPDDGPSSTRNPFPFCYDCVLIFTEIEEWEQHVRDCPGKEKESQRENYSCDDCGENLENFEKWRSHQIIDGECSAQRKEESPNNLVGPEPIRKPDPKRFRIIPKQRSTFRIEYRPFPCGKCKVYFATKRHLTTHFVMHQRADLTCGLCGKLFQDGDSLIRHAQAHLKPPSLICKFCNKRYLEAPHLLQHKFEHDLKVDDAPQIFEFSDLPSLECNESLDLFETEFDEPSEENIDDS